MLEKNMKNAKRKGTQVDCGLTKISCMKQSMAAVYATGLQQRSYDTHVRANRYSSLLFFAIQFLYFQQILC